MKGLNERYTVEFEWKRWMSDWMWEVRERMFSRIGPKFLP